MSRTNPWRYSRGNFYGTTTDPNTGKTVLDPINFSFSQISNFLKDKQATIFKVTESEEFMPDLISWKAYGVVDYWWIICLVNNIANPWEELMAGKALAIPMLSDIEEFFQIQNSSVNNPNGQIVNI